MSNIDDLMAAMGSHQVTDEAGDLVAGEDTLASETVADEPQVEEEISEDEVATVEKPADELESDTQTDDDESEIEPAADESGKRYIPEDRFKEVYAKEKEATRKAEALEKELNSLKGQTPSNVPNGYEQSRNVVMGADVSKADLLETEFLYKEYPQFNPNKPDQYSSLLDQMGAEIYNSNPGISKLEAARRALDRAAQLTQQVNATKGEARVVKQQIADTGMASRASRSQSTEVNPDNMSEKELEALLKSQGYIS